MKHITSAKFFNIISKNIVQRKESSVFEVKDKTKNKK
jgi:hypothetical protein